MIGKMSYTTVPIAMWLLEDINFNDLPNDYLLLILFCRHIYKIDFNKELLKIMKYLVRTANITLKI